MVVGCDGNPGNDFVPQSYNPVCEPAAGDFVDALRAAQAPWGEVSTATFGLRFAGMTKRCPSLQPDCPAGLSLDGFNDVGWLTLTSGGAHALGITIVAFDTATGFILESDIALDPSVGWFTGDPPAPSPPPCPLPPPPGEPPPSPVPPVFDTQTVMLHENGHLAGLDHSLDCNAVTFPRLAPFATKRMPTEDDAAALSALYPLDFVPLPFEGPPPRTPENPHGPPPPEVTVLARLGDPAPGGGLYVNDIELLRPQRPRHGRLRRGLRRRPGVRRGCVLGVGDRSHRHGAHWRPRARRWHVRPGRLPAHGDERRRRLLVQLLTAF